MPINLETLHLNEMMPVVVPNFHLYTPKITILQLRANNFSYIPDEYMRDLQLEEINIRDNKLETIPDLFYQPLQVLRLAGNPLRCNESLCWVRLRARKKTIVLAGIASAVCQSHSSMAGKSLLDVDAVKMRCCKGECDLYCMTQFLGDCLSRLSTSLEKYNGSHTNGNLNSHVHAIPH